MNEELVELFRELPKYLGGHMLLSVTALAVGLAISLPLGLAASRRPKLAEFTLGVAGVIQTVPSLALLAVMVLALGGLIGFVPAFLALILYSVLPILANTITGIRGIDPTLTEAAQGLGMSRRQMRWRVELPLAAPVIISGIRTATVLIVGTATLVTPVGGESLGYYIFGGLESFNHVRTVFGCVAAALLAVLLDQLIHVLEMAARRRSRALVFVGTAGLMLVLLGGLYYPAARLFASSTNRAVVATGPFTEQHILSGVLARRLDEAGFRPDQRLGMSEGIQFEGLRHNQVDLMVNYTGNIWTLVMKRQDSPGETPILEEVTRFLDREYGIVCLGSLGFENAYALAVRREWYADLPIRSVTHLAEYIRKRARGGTPLKIGGDNQFFGRPEWRWLKAGYGISEDDVETVAMDPALLYGALKDQQVDVIVAYTSDGRIPLFGFELLDDPKKVMPPYDAVLLLSPAAAGRPKFQEGLKPLLGTIQLETMRVANRRVDVDKQSPARASVWLWEAIESRQKQPAQVKGVSP